MGEAELRKVLPDEVMLRRIASVLLLVVLSLCSFVPCSLTSPSDILAQQEEQSDIDVLGVQRSPLYEDTYGENVQVDMSPTYVNNAQLDGWIIDDNKWHYALGKPTDKANDGWVGFGANYGDYWLKFRLAASGYMYWPTKEWSPISTTPNYDRSNLSNEVEVIDGVNIASTTTWDNIWTTPGGGVISAKWEVDSTGLQEDITINSSARNYITTNHPPSTAPSDTYFGFVFQVDWSDIPQCVINDLVYSVNDDFSDIYNSITFTDEASQFLGMLPPATLNVMDGGNIVDSVPLQRRFWTSGGNGYLLLGVNCEIASGLPSGDLVFDPDVTIYNDVKSTFEGMAVRAGTFWTSSTVGYVFYIDNGTTRLWYKKTTDGGDSWGAAVLIFTYYGIMSFDCWADWDTPSDYGTVIHVVGISYSSNVMVYNSLDTSDDSVGTQYTIRSDVVFHSSGLRYQNFCSVTKSVGGTYLLVYRFYTTTSGAYWGTYTSTDPDSSWTSQSSTTPFESVFDYALLYPGNESDQDDCYAIYYDYAAGGGDFSLKLWDNSGTSWTTETAILTQDSAGDYNILGVNGAIRLSDGHLLIAIAEDYDGGSNYALSTWDVTDISTVTQKTDVISADQEWYCPVICVDQLNDYVYVAWLVGGTWGSSVDVYYKVSDDDMASWGSASKLNVTTDDLKWLSMGSAKTYTTGLFEPVWFNDDLNDILVNSDNAILIGTITTPESSNSCGASVIYDTSAKLNGYVVGGGGIPVIVYIYWGDNDGVTTPGNWDNEEDLGTFIEGDHFYFNATGLSAGTGYFYRCYVDNGTYDDWADSTSSFTTVASISAGVGSNWLTGWDYRKQVSITGGGSAGTNYQVYLDVYSNNGTDDDGVIYLGNKCEDFPTDVVITGENGLEGQDYWRGRPVSSSEDLGASNTNYYVASNGHIWRGDGYESTDGGSTWNDEFDISGYTATGWPFIDSRGYIYLSANDGTNYEVYRTTTEGGGDGTDWSSVLTFNSSGIVEKFWYMTEDGQNNLHLGLYTSDVSTKAAKIYKSTAAQAGSSWTVKYSDTSTGRHIHALGADPYQPGYIYATQGDQGLPAGCIAKLLLSTDYGETYNTLKSNDLKWQFISVAFGEGYRLWGTDSSSGELYKTTDDSNYRLVFDGGTGNIYWGRTFNDVQLFSVSTTGPSSQDAYIIGSSNDGEVWFETENWGTYTADYKGSTSASNVYNGHIYVNDTTQALGRQIDIGQRYWVKVEDDLSSGETSYIYVYYGNDGTICDGSCGYDTFILFDDFERGYNGSAPGGEWTVDASPITISSLYDAEPADGSRAMRMYDYGAPTPQAHATLEAVDNISIDLAFMNTDEGQHFALGNGAYVFNVYTAGTADIYYYDGSGHDSGGDVLLDAFSRLVLNDFDWSNGTYDIYDDDTLVTDDADMDSSASYEDELTTYGSFASPGYGYMDRLLVHKWDASPPTVGTPGSEETPPSLLSVFGFGVIFFTFGIL